MAITAQEQDRSAGALTEIRPHLNERQWRLLLGAQARAVGRGGIKLVARVAGASVDTVGRGAGELEAGISPDDRVRAVGAGRRSVEAVDPGGVRGPPPGPP
jgi:hypothetical protein